MGSGWPLGLETVNITVQIMNAIRAMERSPLHLTTPSFSSSSSSDLDTESSASFFAERSTTLGNLMGIPSRQHRSSNAHPEEMGWSSTNGRRPKNNGKMRSWRFLIGCLNMNMDEVADAGAASDGKTNNQNAPSLRDLLEAHRRARSREETVYINVMKEASDLEEISPLLLGDHGIPESMSTRGFLGSDVLLSMEEIPLMGNT